MNYSFVTCFRPVSNRGNPPVDFLNALVDWGKTAPAEVFERNSRADIYGSVKAELGPINPQVPWVDVTSRRAAMLECLRVLAGFESSWHWKEGADANAGQEEPDEVEAGPFQVSANSMHFDASLKAFVVAACGGSDPRSFVLLMKTDHKVAIGYAARLLRFTTAHNGPVKRKEINPWLSRDAMAEFQRLLID